MQYRFLPSFFARTFCVILPFAMAQDLRWLTPVGSGLVGMMFLLAVQVGRDLADPFRDQIHDVPMTAITRTIEIDLLETIGGAVPGPGGSAARGAVVRAPEPSSRGAASVISAVRERHLGD